MATYKLIQDIEAEDHILGPLTLRQFIFALIAVFFFYICFILIAKHVLVFLPLFLPFALFFGFFALPFGRDQPTEVWALAKLRFWFLPRRRIWNQSGVKDMVTITVPKKVERVLTNGLSQTEVKSRLQALASTIDSRGWAVKHVNVNAYTPPQVVVGNGSDRLLDLGNLPQEVPNAEITAADDIMDANHNVIARQFDTMINQSAQAHRQLLVDQLNSPEPPVLAPAPAAFRPTAGAAVSTTAAPPLEPVWTTLSGDSWTPPSPGGALPASPAVAAWSPPASAKSSSSSPVTPDPSSSSTTAPSPPPINYWFMDQGSTATPPMPAATVPVTEADRAAEATLVGQLKLQTGSKSASYGRMRTIQPLSSLPTAPASAVPSVISIHTPANDRATPVTDSADPAILSLAQNNDLNVATLARQARKSQPDEVVISLH